jgi:GAF domain/ANTAR domain
VEPIPESLFALNRLSELGGEDMVAGLRRMAQEVVAAAPNCVGMSIAAMQDDLTFTFTASDDRFRLVDAAQYLEGGPCEEAALTGREVRVDVAEVLDEGRWLLFAQASAAEGIKSSLSFPLKAGGPFGSVNLYANTFDAFEGRVPDLAAVFGTIAAEAITNADLSMRSQELARRAPQVLASHYSIDQAIGLIAGREHIDIEAAETRLREAAARATVPLVDLARLVLSTRF